MKWTYFVRQKLKVAVLLFCIMACSILIRVLEDKYMDSVGEALTSMYDDRLVPASYIFDMGEQLYAKRTLLHGFISDPLPSHAKLEQLNRQLAQHDMAMDTLLGHYEKTYLVDQEKIGIQDFKNRLAHYSRYKQQWSNAADLERSKEISTYMRRGLQALDAAILELGRLEKLQIRIGRELMSDAQSILSGSRFFSMIQIVLSIVLGVMVVMLVLESKSVMKNKQPFNLN